MTILAQFLLRLTFGLALGMAITSPRQVSSGYFRNNLYVTLGLTTLAALVLAPIFTPAAFFAGLTAVLSFVGAACWLYEAKCSGIILTKLVAACALLTAWLALIPGPEQIVSVGAPPVEVSIPTGEPLRIVPMIAVATSGLVLGVTFAAMLLGHWYLNSPGMELGPLRRLIAAAAIAVGIQAIVSGAGLVAELSSTDFSQASLHFVLLRWCFGIVGVAVLLWMARETLKIPNTQSATGILYVAVIGVFVGELTSLLLSAESAFPL